MDVKNIVGFHPSAKIIGHRKLREMRKETKKFQNITKNKVGIFLEFGSMKSQTILVKR